MREEVFLKLGMTRSAVGNDTALALSLAKTPIFFEIRIIPCLRLALLLAKIPIFFEIRIIPPRLTFG